MREKDGERLEEQEGTYYWSLDEPARVTYRIEKGEGFLHTVLTVM